MNILIVEDSQTIGSILYRLLDTYGYAPHLCQSSRNPLSQVKTYHPAIIIIDTVLEHTDASELCKEVRSSDRSTIIVGLHSRGPWQHKVEILKSGADDCIAFPFPGQELLARINALLRRPRQCNLPTITLGNITVIPDEREAFYNDKPLELSKTEYQLLEYLVKNNNRAVSRAELLDHVWDYSRIINSNTVDVHIRKLRQKMSNMNSKEAKEKSVASKRNNSENVYVRDNFTQKDAGNNNIDPIKTIHGIGYRLDGNIGVDRNPKEETPKEMKER